MTDSQPKDLLFEEITPLGFYVHVTKSLWELIVTAKHPVMAGKQTEVQAAIKEPDTILSALVTLSITNLLFVLVVISGPPNSKIERFDAGIP